MPTPTPYPKEDLTIAVVQLLIRIRLFTTPWTTARQAPHPSPTPRVYLDLCQLNQWCHPTISSSVTTFSFCLQSFPASGSFSMSQLFVSCGQSIGPSASASVLPMRIQGWFPLWLTGLISLSKGLSRVLSSTTVQKRQFFSFMVLLSHPYMATEKNINLTIWTFVGKVMSPLFYMLSRFVTAFLLKSECLLISWLQLPSTESPRKCLSLFPLFPHLFAMKSWDLMPWS